MAPEIRWTAVRTVIVSVLLLAGCSDGIGTNTLRDGSADRVSSDGNGGIDGARSGDGAIADGNNTGSDTSVTERDVTLLGDGTTSSDGGGPVSEICDNGIDDDRDGMIDEMCPCLPGTTQRCFPGAMDRAGIGACTFGMQVCEGGSEFGTWRACTGATLPAGETCDGIDNDCDGHADNGCECRASDQRACYTGPAATRAIGACRDGSQTCASGPAGIGSAWGTCAGETLPAAEACDGIDNDCNGTIDDGCACTPGAARMCYGGPMGTSGIGPCRAGTQTCVTTGGMAAWGSCAMQTLPTGEMCDMIDNDCDGTVDDGCECPTGATRACYTGAMGTRGIGLCADGTQRCVAGAGGIGSSWGACTGERLPGSESCDDLDNNCNGAVDDGCACRRGDMRACYTGPAATAGLGICRGGMQGCVVELGVARWDRCSGEVLPATEVCDDIDNDCDGLIDDGCACRRGETRSCYSGPRGTAGVGVCAQGSQSCVVSGGVAAWGACGGEVGPGAEICDRIDNNCNGVVDDGCACTPGMTRSCYPGPVGTAGVGTCAAGSQTCVSGTGGIGSSWGTCGGYSLPGSETCNSTDDDCDGMIDEGCACTAGATRSCYGGTAGTAGVGVCRAGSQTCAVASGVASWGTCSGEVRPAAELCDGIDNDCDGIVDDGCQCAPGTTQACYTGPTGTSGVGVCRAGSQSCVSGVGGVGSTWGACAGQTLPGPEVCDARDSDCDGTVDEGCACAPGATQSCYTGPTGTSGVGICRAGSQSCVSGSGGVGSTWGTCSGQVLPASETCNMVDDNCNGAVDDGLSCSGPTVTCPAPITAPAGTTVTLTATATNAVSYLWEVTAAPPGGAYTFGSARTATTTFTSFIVGTYTVRVTVTDSMGRTATCTTTVTMTPHGLRVELSWDTANDIDLHVHNALATTWFSSPSDCYYANRGPAWDAAGTADDPRLDVDDIDGFGPENTRVDSPVLSQTYSVGVHYYSGTPASSVTVRIYCGSTLAAPAFVRTMRPGSTSDRNDFWRVARVRFTSASACTVTTVNDVILSSAARTGSP